MSFLSKNDPTDGELIKGIDLDDDPELHEEAEPAPELDEEVEVEPELDEEAEPAPEPATDAANPYDELFDRNKRRARFAQGAGR